MLWRRETDPSVRFRAGRVGCPREEVAEQVVAAAGQDALGVELHTLDRQLTVTDAHHHTVDRAGGDIEAAGDRRRIEWYRVAVNGDGSPANTPSPTCSIGDVLPCINCGARTTSAPYT